MGKTFNRKGRSYKGMKENIKERKRLMHNFEKKNFTG
jgi:hypothetical protein